MDYTVDTEVIRCAELDCEGRGICSCSRCLCCSICSALCDCPSATTDPNKKMAQILGFGDVNYRLERGLTNSGIFFLTFSRTFFTFSPIYKEF